MISFNNVKVFERVDADAVPYSIYDVTCLGEFLP